MILKKNDKDPHSLMNTVNTVCQLDQCTGCMVCINVCSKSAIQIRDDMLALNAVIDENRCINCDTCKRVCPNNNPCKLNAPIYWKQGWASDEFRNISSSGGVASAIISAFIDSGGFVASCLFENGAFRFKIIKDKGLIKKIAGSKYVKSYPGTIYKEVEGLLSAGQKVLFVGLPCQSAAILNHVGHHDNLFTIDMICHGTPSTKLLKRFLTENRIQWENISDIKFRDNGQFGISPNEIKLTPNRVIDVYMLAFLNSVDYTENCYSCKYAGIERVSDITLGDAWGQLSDRIKEGVSLILCQNQKGIDLIESAGLHLENVDLKKAIEANHQLQYPAVKNKNREKFFKLLNSGSLIKKAAYYVIPKDCIKQDIKTLMLRLHLLKDN